jgi:hypothetical protein
MRPEYALASIEKVFPDAVLCRSEQTFQSGLHDFAFDHVLGELPFSRALPFRLVGDDVRFQIAGL